MSQSPQGQRQSRSLGYLRPRSTYLFVALIVIVIVGGIFGIEALRRRFLANPAVAATNAARGVKSFSSIIDIS